MTIFTHVAVAGLIGATFNFSNLEMGLICVGSTLPDLDNPHSFIGRLLPFVTKPMNKFFQHRKFVHSVLLWFSLCFISSAFYPLLTPIFIGAISHIVLDCYTIKGVCLFSPFFESVAVAAPKRSRVAVGSGTEFFILFLILVILGFSLYIRSQGGILNKFREFIGSYETALKLYEKSGQNVSYMNGKLRYKNGIIKDGEWLVVGTEEGDGMAIYDKYKDKVLHIPKDAHFLKVNFAKTEDKWNIVNVQKSSVLCTLYFLKNFLVENSFF